MKAGKWWPNDGVMCWVIEPGAVGMGRIIALAGIDGSGKTTLSSWLRDQLLERGYAPDIIWSRFNNYLSAPFLAATRVTGHNYYTVNEGTRMGFHSFESLPTTIGSLFIVLQAIDVNIATLFKVNLPSRRQPLVICERGPWDTLVDVSADLMSEKLARGVWSDLFLKQVESRTDMVLIERDVDRIRACRPELGSDEKLVFRKQVYRTLAERRGWAIVDNNGPLEETRAQLSNWLDSLGIPGQGGTGDT